MTTFALPQFKPSYFARAVTALLALNDLHGDSPPRSVHLQNADKSDWRVWSQVADFRVDEGNTYYGNFEVRDEAMGANSARSILPPEANVLRQAWAQGKSQQLKGLLHELENEGPPVWRWLAAIVDVLPKRSLHGMVTFQKLAEADAFEFRIRSLTLGVERNLASGDWDLVAISHPFRPRDDERNQVARQSVPAGYPEHLALYKLLSPENLFSGSVLAPEHLWPHLE